ncbi:YHS domain-containing protein [Limibacillus sp. MBR-115]|jgi:toluene monooxygenase system protein A|uniref:YHS domain-containing protein n=1 Tax=Limibacillus sp. MBR-115 TaxID=3156465 RepID=UPI0033987585
MALLAMDEWYDFARQTNWAPTYVDEKDLFPPELSDPFGIDISEWEKFDEPYKVSYRQYVQTQREKDVGAYTVKAALSRSKFFENAAPNWKALMGLHFGAVPFVEFASSSAFARMTRFGRAPGMRNMASFGTLDEIRHAQIQVYFAYEFLKHDRVFDWAHKAPRTDNWIIVSERHTFDDLEHTRDAVSSAIMTNFAFEQAFTNLQFIALSADAARYGDHSFATMLQSIQSDEARHSQIGTPLIVTMLENGKKAEAQQLIDVSFWRCWKQFSALSGVSIDYYTPLEHREYSFKEFMREWVEDQFLRNLKALGIDTPWYWDHFVKDVETFHHAQQLGVYLYRPTEWWRPVAGVSPNEREWLEKKYPGWNDTYGKVWDVIIDNILSGNAEKTIPETAPMLCNMCGLELTGVAGKGWDVKSHYLDYEGRRYHFCSPVERWIFELEPDRYKGHKSIIDRIVDGTVPPGPDGLYEYMDMAPEERGCCGEDYEWAQAYRQRAAE